MDEQPVRLSSHGPGTGRRSPHPVIFLSAGEASGDLHGAALAAALRKRIPGVELVGLGGERMAAEGVELLAGLDDLAVMGFVEVLGRLPFFLRLRRRVFETLHERGVDLVIPIDYPGFNLRLAKHAHGRGIPVLYYIAPQVWAWHKSRARDLATDTDRVAVILPFEEEFLARHGADAEFVGHPLLDLPPPAVGREAWMAGQGLDPARPLLALFPGSRAQEVARHLAIFAGAAERVRSQVPDVQVRIGAPSHLPGEAYGEHAGWVTREGRELLAYATAAVVKSGTTTLESALAETPFVVAYRMNALSYALARRVVDVPHIALANLVAGRRVVPELIQEDASAEALADAVLPLLDEGSARRAEMVAGLRSVRERLGRGGAGERVAEIAADLLARRA